MDYATIDREYEYAFEVNRSKFICNLAPVESVEQGQEYVAAIRKKYSDATHNCYAIVGTPESNARKFSDDGEPSGTAGQPMMAVLTKSGIYAVVAVVTRYFGGIKLGAGGLVQAYTRAVAEALAEAETVIKKLSAVYILSLTYAENKCVNSIVQATEAVIIDTQFGNNVELTLAVPQANESKLLASITELTQGEGRYKKTENKYITYKR